MTLTLALTPEQEERVQEVARSQGVDTDWLLRRLVDGVLDQLDTSPTVPITRRVPGLHAGQYQVPEDFNAPLPESFWLGAE